MNPWYAILESRHRWLIFAGLTLLVGLFGALWTLSWGWPHWLGRVWFWLGAAVTVVFLVRAFLEWKQGVETAESQTEQFTSGDHSAPTRPVQ